MLGRVDASRERAEGVGGTDGDGGNTEHGAVVHPFTRNQVHHHAGRGSLTSAELIERALDRVSTGQLAGHGWVNVHDAAREVVEEGHGQQPHPSGQNDDVGVECGDSFGQSGVVANTTFAGHETHSDGCHPSMRSALQSVRIGVVRYHCDYVSMQ